MTPAESVDAAIPTVSVVIAARNAGPFLDEQLAALAAQTSREPWELVVIDHASTDGTGDRARAWSDRLPIRVEAAPPGGGPSRARNVGIEVSRGEYLLMCDADDIVAPTWIEELVRALQHADIAGGLRVPFCDNERGYAWVGMSKDDVATGTLIAEYKARFFAAHGCNMGFRRATIGKVRFPENYVWPGGEDMAFSWELQRHGATLVSAPRAVVHYRLRDTFKGTIRQRYWWGHSAGLLFRDFPDVLPPRPLFVLLKVWVAAFLDLLRLDSRKHRLWACTRIANLTGRLVGSVRFRVKAW